MGVRDLITKIKPQRTLWVKTFPPKMDVSSNIEETKVTLFRKLRRILPLLIKNVLSLLTWGRPPFYKRTFMKIFEPLITVILTNKF